MVTIEIIKVVNMNIPNLDFSKFDDPSKQDEEQCGVILRSIGPGRTRYDIVRVPNSHPDPAEHFGIKKRHIEEALWGSTALYEAWAIVHTHRAHHHRRPSPHDIASHPPGLLGVVYHPESGSAVWYSHKGVLKNGFRQTR